MSDPVSELPRRGKPEYAEAHRRMLEHRGQWVPLASYPSSVARKVSARWWAAAGKASRGWEVSQRTADGVTTVYGRIK